MSDQDLAWPQDGGPAVLLSDDPSAFSLPQELINQGPFPGRGDSDQMDMPFVHAPLTSDTLPSSLTSIDELARGPPLGLSSAASAAGMLNSSPFLPLGSATRILMAETPQPPPEPPRGQNPASPWQAILNSGGDMSLPGGLGATLAGGGSPLPQATLDRSLGRMERNLARSLDDDALGGDVAELARFGGDSFGYGETTPVIAMSPVPGQTPMFPLIVKGGRMRGLSVGSDRDGGGGMVPVGMEFGGGGVGGGDGSNLGGSSLGGSSLGGTMQLAQLAPVVMGARMESGMDSGALSPVVTATSSGTASPGVGGAVGMTSYSGWGDSAAGGEEEEERRTSPSASTTSESSDSTRSEGRGGRGRAGVKRRRAGQSDQEDEMVGDFRVSASAEAAPRTHTGEKQVVQRTHAVQRTHVVQRTQAPQRKVASNLCVEVGQESGGLNQPDGSPRLPGVPRQARNTSNYDGTKALKCPHCIYSSDYPGHVKSHIINIHFPERAKWHHCDVE
ncbi:hypothetical protein TeGR_g7606, partial [Tetraparma gracilis]